MLLDELLDGLLDEVELVLVVDLDVDRLGEDRAVPAPPLELVPLEELAELEELLLGEEGLVEVLFDLLELILKPLS